MLRLFGQMLGELLKDIQQLEVEEVLAQIDLPLSLTSPDLSDSFLSKDLQDPVALAAADVANGEISNFVRHSTHLVSSPHAFHCCLAI